jgi:hypothetical protein
MLYIMFGGSWDITSWCIIKILHREVVVAAAPTPKAVPHHKWMEMLISVNASDWHKNMLGVGQLPLVVSQTIANFKLYHILDDSGAVLNFISLTAFKGLQILMSKPEPSHPFSGVSSVLVMPCGCISLPVIFETPENFRTESILFDVTEVSLPFNAILGRPALYQFMAVTHYGYLVLKMMSPNDVLKIRGDRNAGVTTLKKLQALAAQHEPAAGLRGQDHAPSSLRQHGSSLAPHVLPSCNNDVPMNTIQIRTDATQTTHITGDLDSK